MNNELTTTKKKELSKVQKVRDLIKSYEGAMARLLPKHVSVERMTQIAMINIGKTPGLADCHAATLVGAILESIRLTLEPGAGPGHTWLIPFRNRKKNRMEVQLIVDYRAIVKRLKTHAGASVVFAEIVRENDEFEYGVGPKGLYLNWKPYKGDRGDIVDYFSAAWNKDCTLLGYNVMTKAEVKAIEDRAPSNYGPWKTDPAWMGKKTAIRPLNKLIPHEDAILSRMGELSDKEEFGIPQDLGMLIDPNEVASDATEPDEIKEPQRKSEAKKALKSDSQATEDKPATDSEKKLLHAVHGKSGKNEAQYKLYLNQEFGLKSRKDIKASQVSAIKTWLEAKDDDEQTEFPT